jgi:rare lipoprotein A
MKTPLRIWLLAGVSSVVLAAGVITFTAQAVHADARLPQPAATMPVATLVASPTPDSLKAEQAAIKRGDRLKGLASWYGGVFNGRHTASGERYDMYAMTACHPTLPFGSLVRVVNQKNKRSVVVRITDRGDLVDEGRIIDLSYGAARRLAILKMGVAKVDLEVLSLGGTHKVN